MKNTRSENSLPDTRLRSRWPAFFGSLALLWCAWWYCRGESQALFMVAAGLAALAVVRSRALPGNARWVIWTGLLVAVVCLAANVSRLVPPSGSIGEVRLWDRLVTVAFALGVTALFFRPGVSVVTVITACALPMLMLVLGRNPYEVGTVAGKEALAVWVFLILAVSLDQAQRLTRPRPPERLSSGAREVLLRLAILSVVLLLAYGLRPPVEQLALVMQKRLLGLVMNANTAYRARHGGDLSLMQAIPRDFGGRTRVILLVRAGRMPGYLREGVFTTYQNGRWEVAKPGLPLRASEKLSADDRRDVYALTPSSSEGTSSVWRVEVLAPSMLSRICLPGNAVALTCEGLPPLADINGAVAANEVFPERYDVSVVPRRFIDSAYPYPDGAADPAYVSVPAKLSGAVSNWVSGCAGLADARTAREAVLRVEAYFETKFDYRLGLQMNPVPDPLVDFMKRREGTCTFFASAAALMFRQCGLPSRVVSGYVCCGWNPWLDRWVVREREGHAWVEVWDASEGRWLLADPTPACGKPMALSKPGAVRMALDLLLAGWKRLLFTLANVNLLAVIADAGETVFLFLWQTVWSPAGAVVVAGFSAIWWLRKRLRRRRQTPEERLRGELTEAMCGIGRRAVSSRMRRRLFESWDIWLKRVEPELPVEVFRELREWTESYQELRYRVRLEGPAVRQWLVRARRALRK